MSRSSIIEGSPSVSPFELAAYDYDLPPERIAQVPLAERDASRLLVLDRASGGLSHRQVRDLPELLRPGDVVVVNDTRVIPARLRGETDTGARIEVLLAHEVRARTWECLARPAKRLRPGKTVIFAGGAPAAIESVSEGRVRLRFEGDAPVLELLQQHGEVPLPPYIHRPVGGS